MSKSNGEPQDAPVDEVDDETAETPDGSTTDAADPVAESDADVTTDGDAPGDSPADAPSDGVAAPSTRRGRARKRGVAGQPAQLQSAKRSIWSRLYHGETNIDFVGRRRLWFTISLVAVLVSIVSFATRGLNLGIDFEGGVVWEVPAGEASVSDARDTRRRLRAGGRHDHRARERRRP